MSFRRGLDDPKASVKHRDVKVCPGFVLNWDPRYISRKGKRLIFLFRNVAHNDV